MKRWYVAHTKPGAERLAEGNLERQGFHAYLPRARLRKRGARGASTVTVPLFPRYIFIQLDLENAPWRAVNSTYGISKLVSFGERPAQGRVRTGERHGGGQACSDFMRESRAGKHRQPCRRRRIPGHMVHQPPGSRLDTLGAQDKIAFAIGNGRQDRRQELRGNDGQQHVQFRKIGKVARRPNRF